jgi:hypothetical protein
MKIKMKNFIYFPTVQKITEKRNLLHIVWNSGKESWFIKELILDESLIWLVGFWMGDRTSVNRSLGIGTTEFSVIKSAISIFKLLTVEERIKVKIRLPEKNPNIDTKGLIETYSKKFNLPKENVTIDCQLTQSYTPLFILDSGCNILSRAFRWIENNINNLLEKLPKNFTYIWLAGYFNAEGHVDKTANSLWFSTADKNRSAWLKIILQKIGFNAESSNKERIAKNGKKAVEFPVRIGHRREIRKNDFQLFYNYIFPFMKHKTKRKEVEELIKGYRVRKIDITKYLLNAYRKFDNNWFNRFEFEKFFNLRPRSGTVILKNLSSAKLLHRKGHPNWKKGGQIPYIYKISKLGLKLLRNTKWK